MDHIVFVEVHHSFVADDNNDLVDCCTEELAAVEMSASAAVKDMLRVTFVAEMHTDAVSHTGKEVEHSLGTENNKHSPKKSNKLLMSIIQIILNV